MVLDLLFKFVGIEDPGARAVVLGFADVLKDTTNLLSTGHVLRAGLFK